MNRKAGVGRWQLTRARCAGNLVTQATVNTKHSSIPQLWLFVSIAALSLDEWLIVVCVSLQQPGPPPLCRGRGDAVALPGIQGLNVLWMEVLEDFVPC